MLVVLLCLGLIVRAGAEPLVLSVKVVRAHAGMCDNAPVLEVLHDLSWSLKAGEAFQGENSWEVYWNLEHADGETDLPLVRVVCPGVEVARVIVGRTDVAFEPDGEGVAFRLVADRRRGQLIQTVLTDPGGGLPIDLHHNWEMRRAGRYREGAWPKAKIAAHNNMLFAAREALRLMGPLGRENMENAFEGRIVLEGFETGFTRGHADNPPHFHIMLYPPEYTGAQVPHFYMDEAGRVTTNAFTEVGVARSGRRYGPDEWCALRDLNGRVGLELMIREDGGLAMRLGPDAEEWTLRGVEPGGAPETVGVYRDGMLQLRASVVDDAARGTMSIDIEGVGGGTRSVRETLEYDPFTGRLLKRKALP